ncbi:TIGR00341 family protein [Solirubrobacter sp. CPCC 204708]|uniref:TIGR00341 family protein n=1 Tax=Solirubrobacter deserti TaxID=2282478 RepID=A0ABT4RT41_9ACTN|nr:TIGR00341 family protein [Solirubrobacter deserti]MBE2316444.1 TIGR00341 family protein [Solirubrobacter deserti]MDA0141647.1 TIGR00341 family protein [Solirubrobacter deserti]
MVHLRIVAPAEKAAQVHARLCSTESAINVIKVQGASANPSGDLIMCDVAREDASVIISELRELGIHHEGSIALSPTDIVSDYAEAAEKHAPGSPADAVIWEELDQRTSESIELSAVFLLYMVLASIIAAIGIFLDSPILVVGAMVVGPEFGPVAGLCVALVQLRGQLARRSALALAIGFPLAIAATIAATLLFDAFNIVPDAFNTDDHALSKSISSPDAFAFIVALCAGAAGMLSLSTAKSGALIGVLISVTTIPAAANIGIAAAYGDWDTFAGSTGQLAVNLAAILVAGTATLYVQRLLYLRRKRLRDG